MISVDEARRILNDELAAMGSERRYDDADAEALLDALSTFARPLLKAARTDDLRPTPHADTGPTGRQ